MLVETDWSMLLTTMVDSIAEKVLNPLMLNGLFKKLLETFGLMSKAQSDKLLTLLTAPTVLSITLTPLVNNNWFIMMNLWVKDGQ
jgi:hypothetical protein